MDRNKFYEQIFSELESALTQEKKFLVQLDRLIIHFDAQGWNSHFLKKLAGEWNTRRKNTEKDMEELKDNLKK